MCKKLKKKKRKNGPKPNLLSYIMLFYDMLFDL